jgi:hypothetical protein
MIKRLKFKNEISFFYIVEKKELDCTYFFGFVTIESPHLKY